MTENIINDIKKILEKHKLEIIVTEIKLMVVAWWLYQIYVLL